MRFLEHKHNFFLVVIAFFAIINVVCAQDFHFSQFYNSPLGTNPAHTGAFDGVLRASVIGRTQWLSVTTPFLTIGAEIDAAVYKNNRRQTMVALGLNFNGDKCGDLHYSSAQAIISASFIKNLGRHSRHKIGLGFYGGIINNNIDPSLGTWDNQFLNGIFNIQLPSGENFASVHRLYPDFGAGLFWGFLPNKTTLFRLSLAASHINMPYYDFAESNAKLPIKYSLQFYSQIGVTRNFSIYPMFFAEYQRNFAEYVFGCNAEYFKKKHSYLTIYTLGGGLFYRWNDALIFDVFLSYRNLKFSLAYDVNLSKFRVATHGRGGFEFSVSYILKRKTITRIGKEPCPYDIM